MNTLIDSENLTKLCRRAARRFVRPWAPLDDLMQIAALGVIKAARRWDATRNRPFLAYAWRCAIGELMHYVRDHESMVRVPRRLRAEGFKVHVAAWKPEYDRATEDVYPVDDLALLARLPRRERTVLWAIYFLDLPVTDVARALGYSRRHTARIHRTALRRLREQIEAAA